MFVRTDRQTDKQTNSSTSRIYVELATHLSKVEQFAATRNFCTKVPRYRPNITCVSSIATYFYLATLYQAIHSVNILAAVLCKHVLLCATLNCLLQVFLQHGYLM